ncbi:MAG TPA: phosphotransferase [Ilumatobacteraceae bacterium]|nr:phosphotransferase [Ilumatobacteraceae bacterium]
MSEPGRLVGTGRAADVYDIGDGRVLRRYRTDHDSTIEAAAMRAAWTAGYPVPEVFDADGRDLVMEHLDGPTMLKLLGDRPWRFRRFADQLAELHTRLAGLPIGSSDLPARFEPAECLVHLDLHPGNVMLTSRGPVVIDWSNAGMGPRGADVATTWILLTIAEADDIPAALRPFVGALRRRLLRRFLDGVDRPGREVIRMLAEHRLTDWNLRPGELDKLARFREEFAA